MQHAPYNWDSRPLKRGSAAWWRLKAGQAWVKGRAEQARRFEERATEAQVTEKRDKRGLGPAYYSKQVGWR